MGATSLLRPLRNNTGTLYVFKSSVNDIAKTFTDDNFRFNFSKFVALDLPEISQPSNNSNNIIFQALGNKSNPNTFDTKVLTDLLAQSSFGNNSFLANSFQNYLLNHENIILSKENSTGNVYNNTNKQTTTERLFFKWISNLGAIRFEQAGDESNIDNLLKEETEDNGTSKDKYNRVVKYLGDINLINNVNRGGDSYTEVYLHIPVEHGHTNSVLFKTISDENYGQSFVWEGTSETIEGRTDTDIPGMTVNSYYSDNLNNRYINEGNFLATTNTVLTLSNSIDGSNSYNAKISDADGICIDWNTSNYKEITKLPNVNSFGDFNTDAQSTDFKFNTILIYYDVFDSSSPDNTKRNLYGVLFLDSFENNIGNSGLKSFTKFKPNPITKTNGNSYSLKLNIKFNSNSDNLGVETVINEYNTFSLSLFSDAMISLQNSFEILKGQSNTIITLTEKINNLESFYYNQKSINELKKEVNDLRTSVNNALIGLESPSTLLELIRNNSDRINNLVNGNLGTLTYDLNPFVQGPGIKLDKGTPGRILIENNTQFYNNINFCYNNSKNFNYSSNNGITDINNPDYAEKNNIINLGKFSNYYVNNTEGIENLENDLIINIDDSLNRFKNGQTYRIVFKNNFKLDELNNIYIYTDARNVLNNGSYKWLVAKLYSYDFISNKPIIEIVCLDENLYTFDVNIIK